MFERDRVPVGFKIFGLPFYILPAAELSMRCCDGAMFTVDGAPWLIEALKGLDLQYNIESSRR